MTSGKLLSIVVPVYNVERYIRKCLDSLILSDDLLALLDIVIVNDGSPDSSAEIARSFEQKYSGVFRVIDQENRGHGGAWNHGTEEARGKYLFYLDSDDWFDTAQFSRLVDFLKTVDTDMILLDRTIFHAQEDRNEILTRKNMKPWKAYDANEYDWLHSENGSNITYAHDTVYRTSLMKKYLPLFCEHVMYDDVSLQVIPICIAASFVYAPFNVYHYLLGRPGQSFDPIVRAKHSDHVTIVLQFVLQWIKEHRNVSPIGSRRREWVDDLYSAFPTHHYRELLALPYPLAKERLSKWDSFLRDNYDEIRLTPLVKAYRRFPFPLVFASFRSIRLFERGRGFLKRQLRLEQ